ncbi:aspartyl protease family protein, partial [Genlisea aurea]
GGLGFDVHHRYSDTVVEFLSSDGLPEKGSLDYYAAVAHRDRLFNDRRLGSISTLTFGGGNETFRINSLGFLHYAVVDVGTPPLTFLVALDTGSDLFWLPCDCTSCPRRLNTSSGRALDLNIYSPIQSRTSTPVPCNSTMCGRRRGCVVSENTCAYQEMYLSSNTSTTGILVDDVLHMGTDANPKSTVDVPITLGCGIVQTGDFLNGAAVNGLLGLGMDNVSIPSILANTGLTANSFSMCFGPDGLGRIEFGDKGSADQKTTPFNLQTLHSTYNITVTQIAVENDKADVQLNVLFDSGTSFTYLNDPAYGIIMDHFNSRIFEQRYTPDTQIIFEYCYALNDSQSSYSVPNLNLTLEGGNQLFIQTPTVVIPREGGYAYCLAVVKSGDVNIIGQNFMTGYRFVFDRENSILGWKESDCYDSISYGSSTLPVDNDHNHAPSPSVLGPEKTHSSRTFSPLPSPGTEPSPPSGNGLKNSISIANLFVTISFSIFALHFI